MNASTLLERYVCGLTEQMRSPRDYDGDQIWTPIATRALVSAGRPDLDSCCPTARWHPDEFGRREYLALDVCIWDRANKWSAPLFVGELENTNDPDDVRYAAWKVLVVEAPVRALVTYFGPKVAFDDIDELFAAVQDVCDANPGRPLIVIGADARPIQSVEEIRGRHAHARTLVSAPRTGPLR